ncbi:MAG: hypothetical protein E3J90_10375 [Promethearchaeota archaeon]|nr:MAG: hypothetical protein E3J90_10375 [Candidatus Lokiarchaeota archaeon]
MILIEPWIIAICTGSFFIILLTPFIRRINRAFRRSFRRVARRVTRVQRQIAKTDPKIFQAIKASIAKNMEGVVNKKTKKWRKEKDIKKEVKNKVAIEIESQLQRSPMRDMRPLVDKTIEATIDLAFLKEMSKRGDQARIAMASSIGKIFWRLLFPLATAGVLGGLTYVYPDKIPPGSLIIPERLPPPTGGPLLPVDPLDIVQSTAINAAVFGIGALVLVGLIIFLRRR